jgi:hypothetical protein
MNTKIISTLSSPVVSPFGAEEVQDEAAKTIGLHRPDRPTDEENYGHGQRHVQGPRSHAQQRSGDVVKTAVGFRNSTANRAPPKQTRPVGEQDENENVAKNQKVFFTSS